MITLVVMTSIIAGLLTIPIYLLYRLTKGSIVTQHDVSLSIAVLLVATVIFSMAVAFFTQAKRHEVVGISAAWVIRRRYPLGSLTNCSSYCAVLAVFLLGGGITSVKFLNLLFTRCAAKRTDRGPFPRFDYQQLPMPWITGM
jgi:hypothetical protein